MKKKNKKTKVKLQKGDKVLVIAGSDKNKEGKILAVNRETNRVIVEGVNMLTKHIKPGRKMEHQQGGIVHQEGYIHVSNVMYLHDGKPTRLGIQREKDGGRNTKVRIAKSTGEALRN